jgi:hypothetical protein
VVSDYARAAPETIGAAHVLMGAPEGATSPDAGFIFLLQYLMELGKGLTRSA